MKEIKRISKDKEDKVSKESKGKGQSKDTIKQLLSQYHNLDKKSIEGKGIRKKLRRLGYYLSQSKEKKTKD